MHVSSSGSGGPVTGGERPPLFDLPKPRGGVVGHADGDAAVHAVCPRTVFRLGVPTSGVGTTVLVAQRLAATDWVGGLLVVRLHQVVSWVSTTITVTAVSSSFVDDDPKLSFSTGISLAAASFIGVIAAPTAPSLRVAPLVGPIGPLIDVRIGAAAGVSGTVSLVMSIELAGRRR